MEELTIDFLYMEILCHARHMRFIDLYLHSIYFSEIQFLEKHTLFTLDLAGLKYSLAFSDSRWNN